MNPIHRLQTIPYLKTDLHTHTCASGHGTADRITDLAREAARRQMEMLGISERRRFGVQLRYGAEANITIRTPIPVSIQAAAQASPVSSTARHPI